MNDLLAVPEVKRDMFPEKDFISSVHSEIKSTVFSGKRILEKQNDLISFFGDSKFSEVQKVVQTKMQLNQKIDKQTRVSQDNPAPIGLKFINREAKVEFQIREGGLFYSDFAYNGADDFFKQYRAYTNEVNSILSINIEEAEVDRLGFRKICPVIIEHVEALENTLFSIFNPALFSIPRTGAVPLESFRLSEQSLLARKEPYSCIIKTFLRKKMRAN